MRDAVDEEIGVGADSFLSVCPAQQSDRYRIDRDNGTDWKHTTLCDRHVEKNSGNTYNDGFDCLLAKCVREK